MTKEEALGKMEIQSQGDYFRDDVLKAMDIWGKQQAIEFIKWYWEKMSGFVEYKKEVKPTVTSNEIEEKISEFEGKPLEELYSLFLKDQQKGENKA